MVKMFQADISGIEQEEVITDHEKLEKVVTVLGGSMEFIRTFDTGSFGKSYNFSNNSNTYTATPEGDANGSILQGDGSGIEEQNNYYNISMDDIKELHNQVVAEKDKIIHQLKRELREVKTELKELRKSR
ncbi:MAG: hypothetical protein LUD15_08430 [Bacteroides sp.]|nr:hypothetical protein [Bacteroides sp.]